MNDRRHANQPESGEGFNVGDIYFILFRQKWIVLAFCVLAFIATGVVSVLRPPQYESEAKLYIQYLKSVDPKRTDPGESGINVTPGGVNDIVQSELEILSSLDVAEEVVQKVGAERILSKLGGGDDTNAAAGVVLANLIKDDVPKSPSILRVAFQNPDREVARDVLRCIVDVYLQKSGDAHNTETPRDVLTNEIQQLSGEVEEAEAGLSKVKQEAGIISTLDETRKNLSDRSQQLQTDLGKAEVELAAFKSTAKPAPEPASPAQTNVTQEIPPDVMMDYRTTMSALSDAMAELAKAKRDSTPDSPLLDMPRKRVQDRLEEEHQFEAKYPGIGDSASAVMASASAPNSLDPMNQAARAQQLESQVKELKEQLQAIVEEQHLVDSKAAQVATLEQTMKLKREFLNTALERLAAVNNPNHQEFPGGIVKTERPTPAVRKRSKAAKKMMAMAFGGCMAAGLGLAFLIEMVLDRSVKRPGDIENKLKLPLFISIPDVDGQMHALAQPANGNRLLLTGSNSTALMKSPNGDRPEPAEEIAPWDPRHSLHKFYSGLRDRLIVNFEVRNLNHNPKLVGVTSCNRGAGVSTVAAGLAASLSETGDGNVLLVDMRGQEGASQQFHKGRPACGLDAALGSDTRTDAHIHDNLYAASEGVAAGEMHSTLSKRFATLMPKLKASDYDYIIFDMPPVSQTSMTARLSGLMDMVLLVIESEKTNRDSVKRATALLRESKAHVSTVLNKVHTYVPTRLHQEYLDDEA